MSLYADIHKDFGSFRLDVEFAADRECMGILGASGCGKSMTLKCIAGILTPDRGRIVLNGRVLYDAEKGICLTPQERKVGYLFQNYALFPRMTVAGNIGIGIRGKTKEEKAGIVRSMVETFHLEGLENRLPRQLSGGQQQRAALARILASEPDVLLLDEPFSALDSFLKEQLQFEVQKVLKEYGGDVLMVTHSRDEVYRFCRSVVIMSEGRKVEAGDTRELFRCPETLTTAKLSGCKNFSRAEKTGEYTLWAEDWRQELRTSRPVPEDVQSVGIRAHDFVPAEGSGGINRFSAELLDLSEEPFEVSIRMLVNGNSAEEEEKAVWWKVDTPVWNDTFHRKLPVAFTVVPERVMALR